MYPIFLHLKQIPCLVVGAGVVAQRRIFSLLEQEADVTVLAPEPKLMQCPCLDFDILSAFKSTTPVM